MAKVKSNSVVVTNWVLGKLVIEVLGAGKVEFDPAAASEANRAAAERHGWTQRLCDRAAKGRDPQTGKSASPQVKFDAIKELAEYYMSGDVSWRMSGGRSEGGLLFEALCELRSDKTSEQIKLFLETRDAQQLKQLRSAPELVEIMNRLRVERSGEVSVDDALSDLDAM